MEREAQANVFTSFSCSSNFHKCFCNLIETRGKCVIFRWENVARVREENYSFVSVDQNVNFLCSCLHCSIGPWSLVVT